MNEENQLHFQTNKKKEKWCIHSPSWEHHVVRLMRPSWRRSFQSIDLVLLMWMYVMCPENAILRSTIMEKVNDLPPEITTMYSHWGQSLNSVDFWDFGSSTPHWLYHKFSRTALWSSVVCYSWYGYLFTVCESFAAVAVGCTTLHLVGWLSP